MKEPINLLPPPAKQARMNQLYAKRGKSLYASFLIALILIAIGYGVGFAFFWQSEKDAQEQLAGIEQQTGGAVAETQRINALLTVAKSRLVDDRPWMKDLVDVLRVVPNGITITAVQIGADKDSKQVENRLIINGTSSSRSATLQFQQNLEELSWLDTLDAPLQNFASGPEVSFTFTVTRKK